MRRTLGYANLHLRYKGAHRQTTLRVIAAAHGSDPLSKSPTTIDHASYPMVREGPKGADARLPEWTHRRHGVGEDRNEVGGLEGTRNPERAHMASWNERLETHASRDESDSEKWWKHSSTSTDDLSNTTMSAARFVSSQKHLL